MPRHVHSNSKACQWVRQPIDIADVLSFPRKHRCHRTSGMLRDGLSTMAKPRFPIMFGRFRVLARLGIGGMGEVFLAVHEGAGGFKRRVALKRLLPHLIYDGDAGESLLAEASLLAQLHHPNICEVYSLEEVEGQHCIVMEYLEGLSLNELVKQSVQRDSHLPLPLVTALFAQACEGLHYAHELRDADGRPMDLIHRDVSPHNLFVTYHGVTKLLDFGIAKTTASAEKTATGAIKGKTAYVSPEQVRARPLDRRTDIFSLGVSLYEALTLVSPFRRESMFATIEAIARATPPALPRLRPTVGKRLTAVVGRALAQDPDRRFSTAIEVRTALMESVEPQARPWSRDRVATYLREVFADALEAHEKQLASWTALASTGDNIETLVDVRPAESDSETSEKTRSRTDPSGGSAIREAETRSAVGLEPVAASSTPDVGVSVEIASSGEQMRAPRNRALLPAALAAAAVALAATWYLATREGATAEPVVIYRERSTPAESPTALRGASSPEVDRYTRALAAHKRELLVCLREHAAQITGSPELHLHFQIDAEGVVQHASLEPRELADTDLGACVSGVATRLRFEPTGASTTVRVPLRIQTR